MSLNDTDTSFRISDTSRHFVVTVAGHLCTWDAHEGDRFVIDPERYPQSGELILALLGGTPRLMLGTFVDQAGTELFVVHERSAGGAEHRYRDFLIVGTAIMHEPRIEEIRATNVRAIKGAPADLEIPNGELAPHGWAASPAEGVA